MDTTLDKEENARNIYVIRRKLAVLKRVIGYFHYVYSIDPFVVNIFTYKIKDIPDRIDDCILNFKTVNVVVNEITKSNVTSSISLRDDVRFKDYKPIQYNIIETPNGIINCSNGDNMPIAHLCELISYLHRLSNLTAFV